MIDSDVAMLEALRETVHPLSDPDPHDALIDAVGNARLVLLGEASHGTTSSTRSGLASPSGWSSRKGSTPSRSKPTGPTRTA